MPTHRGLNLKRFVFAVPWNLFQRYFEQLKPDAKPSLWTFLNPDVLGQFLEDPENAQASPIILEDFRRINDLAGGRVSLLIHAHDVYGAPCDAGEAPEAMAMRLFLDHREAFEHAWTLYLLVASTSRIYEFRFPAGLLSIG